MEKYINKRLDGRYEIESLIGVGGMAWVYKAHDTIDDRTVAVKILKEEFLGNSEFTRRFKNESKAIAILSHTNIVKVYDVSLSEKLQYIVMEYIDGITLKEYIEAQKILKWKETVHFTVQILRALQHAHDKGIVHRDVKPQNIMLLADGTIKVTDFGIARFSRSNVRVTATPEKAIGSVHYISPEQAKGDITDEKADIYSVGVMIYEMLTGKLPFEGDNAVSIAIMQMQAQPKKPSEINPDIPEGLEEITIKAMQKNPAKRYQSAAEMLYDIDEFKRNPSIHFAYKYFVDESPTHFVETGATAERRDVAENNFDEVYDEHDEAAKGPPVIPILAAISGAIILITVVVILVISAFQKMNNDSDIQEIMVPMFVGKSYNDVIQDPEYREIYKFTKTEISSEEVEPGMVVQQTPNPQTQVKYNGKTPVAITLKVSTGKAKVEIPEFSTSETFEIVEKRLKEKGLLVTKIDKNHDTIAEGCVISLSPVPGESVDAGTTVQIVVSSGAEVVEADVPDVVHAQLEIAIAKLTADGFSYKVNPNPRNSQYPKDTILEQSLTGTQVKGSVVELVVSSGLRDLTFTVVYPHNIPADVTLNMYVYIDGVLFHEYSQGNITAGYAGTSHSFTVVNNTKTFYSIEITVDDGRGAQTYARCNNIDASGANVPPFVYMPYKPPAVITPTTTASKAGNDGIWDR